MLVSVSVTPLNPPAPCGGWLEHGPSGLAPGGLKLVDKTIGTRLGTGRRGNTRRSGLDAFAPEWSLSALYDHVPGVVGGEGASRNCIKPPSAVENALRPLRSSV